MATLNFRESTLTPFNPSPHYGTYQFMSKRRRGNRHTHFQVPSLRSLAAHAVALQSGRPVARPRRAMDTPMTESRSSGTQTNKRSRSAAADGATEVGQGALITIPRNIPRGFNDNYTVTPSTSTRRRFPSILLVVAMLANGPLRVSSIRILRLPVINH